MDISFIIDTINNPEIVEINRLPAHSTLPVCRTSLSGQWCFSYFESPLLISEKIKFDKSISVPGSLQLQGFDKPLYTDIAYPWDESENVKAPSAPIKFNPVGCYNRKFQSDLTETIIHFEGVESCFFLYINDTFVGYSEDSFTPAEFDIKPYLVKGENDIKVIVLKWCSGSWMEDQDFFRLSGIFRDVYLYKPEAVRDVHIKTDMHGSLKVETNSPVDYMELYDGDTLIYKGGLEAVIENPRLWSAEKPYLYTLKLAGMEFKVGFRSVYIENGILKINGQRIVFKGVNRHEFNCEKGRSVTYEDMVKDITLMKICNINAVRTCHYPDNPLWYDLCDRYGLYVIDEANLETHGTWFNGQKDDDFSLPGSDIVWTKAVLDRANSMVQRDKNHPSIIMWSLGNESFGGENFVHMRNKILSLDSSRPIHYEGITHCRTYESVSDVESQMYTTPEDVRRLLPNCKKPFMLCEYAHAMGNSVGNLKEYTSLADEFENYQGGFIWDWIDQAILKDGYLHYGGDFGDYPNSGNFSGDGILFADRTPSPKFAQVKYCYQNVDFSLKGDAIVIKNKSAFDDLSDCILRWIITRNGEPYSQGVGASFERPLGEGEYILTASLFRDNKEIAFEQFQLSKYVAKEHEMEGELQVIDGRESLGVVGRDFSVSFSKQKVMAGQGGMIVSLKHKGRQLFYTGAALNFWRAETDNDRGSRLALRCRQWKTAGDFLEVNSLEYECLKASVKVHVQLQLHTASEFAADITYTIYPQGEILVDYSLPIPEGLTEAPVIGFTFMLDNSFEKISWYGRGPEENYIDRCQGYKLGIYETTASANLTPYLKPQECGNRIDVRWMDITNGEDTLEFEGEGFEFNAQKWTLKEIECAKHIHELPPKTKTVVSINLRQMGVGGDNSWGAQTHKKYLNASGRSYQFHFSIKVR